MYSALSYRCNKSDTGDTVPYIAPTLSYALLSIYDGVTGVTGLLQ